MFEKKRMAETSEIARYAVESGVAKSMDDVIVLEGKVNRICAPDDHKMWSVILWTKETETDNEPKPHKIVCFLFDHSKALDLNSHLSLGLSSMDLTNCHHIFIQKMMSLLLRRRPT
jgi:hypothetical protein